MAEATASPALLHSGGPLPADGEMSTARPAADRRAAIMTAMGDQLAGVDCRERRAGSGSGSGRLRSCSRARPGRLAIAPAPAALPCCTSAPLLRAPLPTPTRQLWTAGCSNGPTAAPVAATPRPNPIKANQTDKQTEQTQQQREGDAAAERSGEATGGVKKLIYSRES